MTTSLGQIRGADWLELQYITAGAIKFTQERLTDLNRVSETFSEPISEAFEDILKKGLEFYLETCDIIDTADNGGKQ